MGVHADYQIDWSIDQDVKNCEAPKNSKGFHEIPDQKVAFLYGGVDEKQCG